MVEERRGPQTLRGTARAVAVALLSVLSISCESKKNAAASAASNASQAPAEKSSESPAVDVVRVVSKKLERTVQLPGELAPYEVVAIYSKVTGFVEWIGVDRGSAVRKGQRIARLVAPEIVSQSAEAEAKLESAQAQRLEAEARLATDESTYGRLKAASATPGVISGQELEVAEKTMEAGRARVRALRESVEAARAALNSLKELESYLDITAPFDGMVTERNVHPGALVGPAVGPGMVAPIVRIEMVARLRLVVPVPEMDVAGIPEAMKVSFTVPAFPGETFGGTVARIARSIDVKTRTMPVELDVMNASKKLAPGMFAEVVWPVRRPEPTLFVPATAVARTTEQTFVVRIRDEKAEWVKVKTGATSGSLVEVFGELHEGDVVAVRGSDELRPGVSVTPRPKAGAM